MLDYFLTVTIFSWLLDTDIVEGPSRISLNCPIRYTLILVICSFNIVILFTSYFSCILLVYLLLFSLEAYFLDILTEPHYSWQNFPSVEMSRLDRILVISSFFFGVNGMDNLLKSHLVYFCFFCLFLLH